MSEQLSAGGSAVAEMESGTATSLESGEGQPLDQSLAPTDTTDSSAPTGPRERDAWGRFIPRRGETVEQANAGSSSAIPQGDGADKAAVPVPETLAAPTPFQYRANRETKAFEGATEDPTTGEVKFSKDSVALLRRQLARGDEAHGAIEGYKTVHQADLSKAREQSTHFETEYKASEAVAMKAIDYLQKVLSPEDFQIVQRELRLDLRDLRGVPRQQPQNALGRPNGQPPSSQSVSPEGFEQNAKSVLDDELESAFLDRGLATLFPDGPARQAVRDAAHQLWGGFVIPNPQNPQSGEKHIDINRLHAFLAEKAELQKVKATATAATSANAFNGKQNGAPTGARRTIQPPTRATRSSGTPPTPPTPPKPETLSQFWDRKRRESAQGLDE